MEGLRAGVAYVDILPRIGQGFGKQLSGDIEQDAQAVGTSAGSKVGGALKSAAVVAAGAIGIEVFKGFQDQAEESRKVAAQTAAVIASTGGAAGLSAKQFGDLATAISKKVGIDDEAIQSGENLLATFTNIRNETGKGNDIFNQATQTITDMSVALGQDMKSSAIQLGKALNDPVQGVTALQRVGVSFTDQQKEQIKTMVAAGDTMGAQKLVLAELTKEFGGSAAAQDTAGKNLSVTWANLQETIGKALLPIIDKLSSGLSTLLGWFTDLSPGTQTAIIAVVGVGGALTAAGLIVGKLSEAFAGLKVITESETLAMIAHKVAALASTIATEAMSAAQWALNAAMDANPIGLLIAGIALLAAGIIYAYQHSDTFRAIVEGLWIGIQKAIDIVVNFGAKIVDVVGGAIDWARDHWPLILGILTGPLGLAVVYVSTHFDEIVGFFKGLPGRLRDAAGDLFGFLKDSFRNVVNWVIDHWNSLQFKLPKVDLGPLGSLGGETIGVPQIPRLATGGHITAAGYALVGERGPELVRLPAGADVIPNGAAGENHTHYEILFTGPVNEPVDIDAQFQRMQWLRPP